MTPRGPALLGPLCASALLAGLLWSCEPEAPPEPGHAAIQQAIGPPSLVGTLGASLGASLAACPGGGFVAGAPGVGTALFTTDGGSPPAQGSSLGAAVACVGSANAPLLVAAGSTGVKRSAGVTWQPLSSDAVLSVARAASAGLPLLVGQPDDTVRFIDPLTGSALAPPLPGTPGFGRSVAWVPGGTRFVVGSVAGRKVELYDYQPGMAATFLRVIARTAVPEFGRAVVVGNLSPQQGLELAVGGQGQVFIYRQDGTLLLTLTQSASASFGSALAIEPQLTPGLDALWVGESDNDQVHRFVGDAGEITNAGTLLGIAFGASLAIDEAKVLAVGAPDHLTALVHNGAVFLQPLSQPPVQGKVMECTVGSPCRTTACELGRCVGGVLCDSLVATCGATETCDAMTGMCTLVLDAGMDLDGGQVGEPDAGTLTDGGRPDAGTNADAGTLVDAGQARDGGDDDAGGSFDAGAADGGEVPDAGGSTQDAGSPGDAGAGAEPLRFVATGCSSAAGVPLGLLGLALLRRRRSRLALLR